MESNSPFQDELFRMWASKWTACGSVLSVVVVKGGNYAHYGNYEVGKSIIDKICDGKKRESMEWIGSPSKMEKLKFPLSKLKQADIIKKAPTVLRHFMCENAKYGFGECLFWDYKIKREKIKCSYKIIKKIDSSKSELSLGDFIEWSKFTTQSFGKKPLETNFEIKKTFLGPIF